MRPRLYARECRKRAEWRVDPLLLVAVENCMREMERRANLKVEHSFDRVDFKWKVKDAQIVNRLAPASISGPTRPGGLQSCPLFGRRFQRQR